MTEMQQFEQRAKDAVSRLLLRQLTVPRIYFDALWPSDQQQVDVLAIDRAGSGDVHVVEIKRDVAAATVSIGNLHAIPAQFRWLACSGDTLGPSQRDAVQNRLMPADGMGRIGLIAVSRSPTDELTAHVLFRAERFAGSNASQASQFVASHEPDIGSDQRGAALPAPANCHALAESEIVSRLREAKELAEANHQAAAFLLAWSTVEAVMRLAADREGLLAEPATPLGLVRLLHSNGALSQSDRDALLRAVSVRNALVHGFSAAEGHPLPTQNLLSIATRLLTLPAPSTR